MLVILVEEGVEMRQSLACMMVLIGGASACSSPSTTFGDVGAGGASSASGSAAGGMAGSGGSSSSAMGGSGPGAGGAGGAGSACQLSDANTCGDGFYCNAPDCQTGTCEPTPKNDDEARAPVCGCDGVNYWNANTAAAHGTPVAATGECAQPTTCAPSDAMPCPSTRHFCAQLVASQANCALDPNNAPGECWGMPEACPPVVSTPWRPCNNTTTLEPCAGECEAIKAKRKHYQDVTCPN